MAVILQCSVSCGPGISERTVICRRTNGRLTDEQLCKHLPRPNNTKSCKALRCQNHHQWVTGNWSQVRPVVLPQFLNKSL